MSTNNRNASHPANAKAASTTRATTSGQNPKDAPHDRGRRGENGDHSPKDHGQSQTKARGHGHARDKRPDKTGQAPSGARLLAGAKLSAGGRTLPFSATGHEDLKPGDRIVVRARRTQSLATVTLGPAIRRLPGQIGEIVRRANKQDLMEADRANKRSHEILMVAKDRARRHKLPMKVFRAEAPTSGDRATVYFSSDSRLDYREYIRDLSSVLRCRIEMRQVGFREEAKVVGGIGTCGQELCCSTFLPRFAPVSIKMAKTQNLVLNPTKVSGQCGRLKCCLMYEQATYEEALKDMPKQGKLVGTPDGTGKVFERNILAGTVRVYFEGSPRRRSKHLNYRRLPLG